MSQNSAGQESAPPGDRLAAWRRVLARGLGLARGSGHAAARRMRRMAARVRAWAHDLGLPAKLLLLTAAFVMLAEVLIFLPSVANYRVAWLADRLTAAELASLAAGAVPGGDVPPALHSDLLRTAQVKAIAMRQQGRRRLVLSPEDTLSIDATYDLRQRADAGFWSGIGRRIVQSGDAIATFLAKPGRVLRVTGNHGADADDFIEIVLPEAPLKAAMLRYGLNVLWLSVIISLFTAALVYVALLGLLVRPMLRITRSMVQFRESPEDAGRIIVPSSRGDEIGTAERELAGMQRQVREALLQKTRLAELGLAVSKINHDLRNMLANAQIISDRLASVPDPTVQRFAPKLIASLDRAIAFCNSSLAYGRAEEAAPRRARMALRPLVEEVGEGLGLPRETSRAGGADGSARRENARDIEIGWHVGVDPALTVEADPEHLFRILGNLVRNAVQALDQAEDLGRPALVSVTARRDGQRVLIDVADNGPGVPPRARAALFRAFQGSSKKGGTGLGLAIAAELVAAHGGTLRLLDTASESAPGGSGATFRIELPDRPADGA